MMWKRKKETATPFNTERVFLAATQPLENVFNYFQTTPQGISSEEVETRTHQTGKNEILHEKRKRPVVMFIKTFINPFIGVLTALAVISLVLDVLMAPPEEKEWTGVTIICVMVLLSAIIRFMQELKAGEATTSLMKMVKNTCSVKRLEETEYQEIDIRELVPGDLVYLAAGDMIPADVRIISSKDLFVSQSSLTGESEPIEKFPTLRNNHYRSGSVIELESICFMGSTVVSGSTCGIVFATGTHTYLGTIAKKHCRSTCYNSLRQRYQ